MFIEKVLNEQTGLKTWTHVYFDNGTLWVPAFWEQALVSQMVISCENIKYKNLLKWNPSDMPIEFMTRAMMGENVDTLCHNFRLTTQDSYKRLPGVFIRSGIVRDNVFARPPKINENSS